MPSTFMGENVTILRSASAEDTGFVEGAGEQVLVRLSDGTEKIVPKADIRDSEMEKLKAIHEPKPHRQTAKPKASRRVVATARKQSANASRYHRH